MLSRDARVRRSTEDVERRGRVGSGTGDEEGRIFRREGGLGRRGLEIEGCLGGTEGEGEGNEVAVLIEK
jgi:hypothetical protein